MDLIALLICGALALGAAWVVAQPLLGGPGSASAGEAAEPEDPARPLHVEKAILYQAIQELDLDFAAGKLSEADYRALRAKQEAQAVELLKAIDGTAAGRKPASKPSPPTR